MKTNFKKAISLILCLAMMTVICGSAFATGISAKDAITRTTIYDNGAAMSAYIPDISKTGDNIKNDVQDGTLYQIKAQTPTITSSVVENERINISGNTNGKAFLIEGDFCSISENGNVLIFNSVDLLKNFRVVYCAVEKNIDDSALYFKSFSHANSAYNVVTKLYLASPENNDFILIEVFDNVFPTISSDSIVNLSEGHELNQYWYAREFEPISRSTEEEQHLTRAGNVSYGILESYTYSTLGYYFKHYMRFYEDCDIRDVARNASSTAGATIRISQKWIESDDPNSASSTSSTLSLKDVSLVYLTRTNTAVTKMQTTGTVTQNGRITSSFKYGLGVGLKGLSTTASLNFTWEPGNDNMDTGVSYEAHTNSPAGGYWREAEGKLKSIQYLNSIGNKYIANWDYAAYTSTSSTASASLIFKYYVDNLLSYTNGHYGTDTRTFSVSIT